MKYPRIIIGTLVVAMWAGSATLAGGKVYEGIVLKAGEGRLVMSDKEGRSHSHDVAADAQITCEGTKCRLEALKNGLFVRVMVPDDVKQTAVKIDARSRE